MVQPFLCATTYNIPILIYICCIYPLLCRKTMIWTVFRGVHHPYSCPSHLLPGLYIPLFILWNLLPIPHPLLPTLHPLLFPWMLTQVIPVTNLGGAHWRTMSIHQLVFRCFVQQSISSIWWRALLSNCNLILMTLHTCATLWGMLLRPWTTKLSNFPSLILFLSWIVLRIRMNMPAKIPNNVSQILSFFHFIEPKDRLGNSPELLPGNITCVWSLVWGSPGRIQIWIVAQGVVNPATRRRNLRNLEVRGRSQRRSSWCSRLVRSSRHAGNTRRQWRIYITDGKEPKNFGGNGQLKTLGTNPSFPGQDI